MLRFVKKAMLFSALLITIIAFSICIVDFGVTRCYRIDNDVTQLFLGDSHSQLAIVDTLIPRSLNLSSASEPYYYTYNKLKTVLSHSSSIEKVYLSVSPHNLSSYIDDVIVGDRAYLLASKYFFMLPAKEKFRVFVWSNRNALDLTQNVIFNGIESIIDDRCDALPGCFQNKFSNVSAVDSSVLSRVSYHFFPDDDVLGFSDRNIYYLDRIASLCNAKDVELILIQTPVAPLYRKNVPKQYDEKLKDIRLSLGVSYIDMSEIYNDDSLFIPDGDHLSVEGAYCYSMDLKSRIQSIEM